MKVLITGKNSYIGDHVNTWLLLKGSFDTHVLDMIGEAWRDFDMTGFDAVYHVAGIAHADVGSVSDETKALYYKVNCDLAYECAKKAKEAGVGQFIYMSSQIVYRSGTDVRKKTVIDRTTKPDPENFYGDSKLQAEIKLESLRDDTFRVVILRPPMIYGRESKGNFQTLVKMALKLPVFPAIINERSMLYVDNLSEFVSLMLINHEDGVFWPQNSEYVCTANAVSLLAEGMGRKVHLLKILNPFVYLLGILGGKFGKLANKAFGSVVCDLKMSEYKDNYRVVSFEESIRRSLPTKGGDSLG